jgi:hypothetical protein
MALVITIGLTVLYRHPGEGRDEALTVSLVVSLVPAFAGMTDL